jgi:hypothetical protein
MVPPNSSRIISRDGVNTARLFFEHHSCRFQEIDQQQDVYVDLVDEAGITPLCVALPIKSGVSYRTGKADYTVPVEHHTDLWRPVDGPGLRHRV